MDWTDPFNTPILPLRDTSNILTDAWWNALRAFDNLRVNAFSGQQSAAQAAAQDAQVAADVRRAGGSDADVKRALDELHGIREKNGGTGDTSANVNTWLLVGGLGVAGYFALKLFGKAVR